MCCSQSALTSHEFTSLSWWAARDAVAAKLELIHEESEHRQVWGLQRNSGVVTVVVPWMPKKRIAVEVVSRGEYVGLNSKPSQLTSIVVLCPPEVSMDRVLAHARKEYASAYRRLGLQVFYTRKHRDDVDWEAFGMLPGRSIGSVSLDGGMELDLLADARRFMTEREVYDRAGRPYKRVYCLHGPPGTGKASMVIAIATELGKDSAIFNVDTPECTRWCPPPSWDPDLSDDEPPRAPRLGTAQTWSCGQVDQDRELDPITARGDVEKRGKTGCVADGQRRHLACVAVCILVRFQNCDHPIDEVSAALVTSLRFSARVRARARVPRPPKSPTVVSR